MQCFFQAHCHDDDSSKLCNLLSAKDSTIISRYTFILGFPLPDGAGILYSLGSASSRETIFNIVARRPFTRTKFDGALVTFCV